MLKVKSKSSFIRWRILVYRIWLIVFVANDFHQNLAHADHIMGISLFGQTVFTRKIDHMSRFFSFCFQIESVVIIRFHNVGDMSVDTYSMAGQTFYLLGIGRDQLNCFHLEGHNHMSRNPIIAFTISESECQVGLNSILSMFLQSIRTYLVYQAYPPTFLVHV